MLKAWRFTKHRKTHFLPPRKVTFNLSVYALSRILCCVVASESPTVPIEVLSRVEPRLACPSARPFPSVFLWPVIQGRMSLHCAIRLEDGLLDKALLMAWLPFKLTMLCSDHAPAVRRLPVSTQFSDSDTYNVRTDFTDHPQSVGKENIVNFVTGRRSSTLPWLVPWKVRLACVVFRSLGCYYGPRSSLFNIRAHVVR